MKDASFVFSKFSERIGLDLSSQICWSQISGREDHLESLLGSDIVFLGMEIEKLEWLESLLLSFHYKARKVLSREKQKIPQTLHKWYASVSLRMRPWGGPGEI